jgi:hypothetical protein
MSAPRLVDQGALSPLTPALAPLLAGRRRLGSLLGDDALRGIHQQKMFAEVDMHDQDVNQDTHGQRQRTPTYSPPKRGLISSLARVSISPTNLPSTEQPKNPAPLSRLDSARKAEANYLNVQLAAARDHEHGQHHAPDHEQWRQVDQLKQRLSSAEATRLSQQRELQQLKLCSSTEKQQLEREVASLRQVLQRSRKEDLQREQEKGSAIRLKNDDRKGAAEERVGEKTDKGTGGDSGGDSAAASALSLEHLMDDNQQLMQRLVHMEAVKMEGVQQRHSIAKELTVHKQELTEHKQELSQHEEDNELLMRRLIEMEAVKVTNMRIV